MATKVAGEPGGTHDMALSGEEGSYKVMSSEQSQMQKVTEDEQRDPTDWQGGCWWRVNMRMFTGAGEQGGMW